MRFRRVVAFALVLAACSNPGGETTSTTATTAATTAPSSTTSTAPTTTAPTVTLELSGTPDGLADAVAAPYEYAFGVTTVIPDVPPALVPETVEPRSVTLDGDVAVATFDGSQVAVVEIGDDVWAAVDDGDGWRIVGGSAPSLGIDPWWGDGPRIVAVVGSDARPGENRDRARADSLHLVGLDGTGGGAVVGIPRDAYTDIPGRSRNRVNASLALGGPDLLAATLEELSGLHLDGYVLTGFEGFTELIGILGGVEVEIPFDIADRAAQAYLKAGRQVLDGAQALAFARVRKTIPGGDFTRQAHGGLIIKGAVGMLKLRGPLALPAIMERSEPWITTNLSAEELLTFALGAMDLDLGSVPNVVVPGRAARIDDRAVVRLTDGAAVIFADLADGRLEASES